MVCPWGVSSHQAIYPARSGPISSWQTSRPVPACRPIASSNRKIQVFETTRNNDFNNSHRARPSLSTPGLGQLHDRVRGGYGDDVIDGGAGMDTASYRYRYAEYDIRRLEGGDLEVAYTGRWHGDGTDRLSGVEHLEFLDTTIMVDDLML